MERTQQDKTWSGADQWRRIWLEKFGRKLSEHPVSAEERGKYSALVERFLQDHPAPKFVNPGALREYAQAKDSLTVDGLGFFYRWVVRSDEHADLLRTMRESRQGDSAVGGAGLFPANAPAEDAHVVVTSPPTLPQHTAPAATELPGAGCGSTRQETAVKWLASLENALRLRNYSFRTVHNYRSAVRAYLEFFGGPPGAGDEERVKGYLLGLKSNDGFAPRTVNLTAAALSFFYREVVGAPGAVDRVPRMKPGKQLPKVYSLEEVERIINSTENPKH